MGLPWHRLAWWAARGLPRLCPVSSSKSLMFIRTKLAAAVVLGALVTVNSLPIQDALNGGASSAKRSINLLGQVSALLTEDVTTSSSKLLKAREEVKGLQKQLADSAMKVAQAKELSDHTKADFDRYVGDHDACIMELQALGQAGLASLKKLRTIKSQLAQLAGIVAQPVDALLQVKAHRPHDKLVGKMSSFIDTLVTRIG